jgi:HB1, ASXL, restriction endonuclease HTH domain
MQFFGLDNGVHHSFNDKAAALYSHRLGEMDDQQNTNGELIMTATRTKPKKQPTLRAVEHAEAPSSVCFFIRGIPPRLRDRFKARCADEGNTSMSNKLIELMDRYVREKEGNGEPAAPTPDAPAVVKPPKPAGQMSMLDAAAKLLAETDAEMTCQEMVSQMAEKGYWSSPNGKTPDRTLGAALGVDIRKHGPASRFYQPGKGKFGLRK